MKNVFGYVVLVICIVIYGVSLSDPLTKEIAVYKYKTHSIWGSDKYRYGDLFGMSFYPGFQIPITLNATAIKADKCDTTDKAVDLYALCDSYIWSIVPSDTFYCNVDKWKFATVNKLDYLQVQLDTDKANILLIEFAERNIVPMLQQQYSYLTDFIRVDKKTSVMTPIPQADTVTDSYLFNKNINTNIEFNVFETAVFTPLRKMKAALNYTLFQPLDTNVAIGPDKKYLLYKPTVTPSFLQSSFRPISDSEIDTMVNRLNEVYFYYKKIGFREVYFSMIPNSVTILYPDYNGYQHNQLIPRIQGNRALKIPVIDVYSDFRNAPFPIYQKSDSHWNMDGATIWLNKLNKILRQFKK